MTAKTGMVNRWLKTEAKRMGTTVQFLRREILTAVRRGHFYRNGLEGSVYIRTQFSIKDLKRKGK